MEKKGQVTIFVIIAIVIVAAGAAVYTFYPGIKDTVGLTPDNPSSFIENCMEDDLTSTIELVSSNGGSVNPQNYFLYDESQVDYLCYTTESLQCVVQKPLLKQSIEIEIRENIKGKVDSCFAELRNNFESQGNVVEYKQGKLSIELLPQIIITKIEKDLKLTKGGETENYDKIELVFNNNLYELISIANSIIESEVEFGEAETTTYMNYYHDLKVERKEQSEGTNIYILTTRSTGDKFQFASRSVPSYPGIIPPEFKR